MSDAKAFGAASGRVGTSATGALGAQECRGGRLLTQRGALPTRKPPWLRAVHRTQGHRVRRLLGRLGVNTICREAGCPNMGECFAEGTTTFLLMGKACTRNCRFCRVHAEKPEPLDPKEGERVAEAVEALELDYVVLTSVTRDDLRDGGAAHLRTVVEAVRHRRPHVRVELLIPDFGGDQEALATALGCRPDVLGHNLETVPRLYGTVRPEANYQRSLEVLGQAKVLGGSQLTKSALVLGLGETPSEVLCVMQDMRSVGCDLLVLGQYLQPSREHLPVSEYWTPERLAWLQSRALAMGFRGALCRPLARSSYQARQMFEALVETAESAGKPEHRIGE